MHVRKLSKTSEIYNQIEETLQFQALVQFDEVLSEQKKDRQEQKFQKQVQIWLQTRRLFASILGRVFQLQILVRVGHPKQRKKLVLYLNIIDNQVEIHYNLWYRFNGFCWRGAKIVNERRFIFWFRFIFAINDCRQLFDNLGFILRFFFEFVILSEEKCQVNAMFRGCKSVLGV